MATGVLQKGTTFSDGMVVNAATLNNLVDLGDVLQALISNKTDVAPTSGDFLLYVHGTNLFKCTFSEISASGAGGVSSVGLTMPATEFNITGTPITGSGTLGVTWDNQPLHTILAGPKTGSPAAPNFRLISSGDMAVPSVNIAASTIDWSLGTNFWKVLPNSSFAFSAFTNAVDGMTIKVLLTSGGTSTTVAWPGVLYWPNNTKPVQTPLTGGTDLYILQQINSAIIGYYFQHLGTG